MLCSTLSFRASSWRIAAALAIVALSIPQSAVASRPEIEQLLRDMQTAVLAGDPEAYLRHVDPRDAVFLQEQKMWADDLTKQRPESFTLRIVDAPAKDGDGAPPPNGEGDSEASFKLGDGSAEARLEMLWSMAGWSKPRSYTYTARFRRDADAWLYRGERWDSLEADGVLVLFDEGLDEIAKSVARLLPEVRRHVHPGFGFDEKSALANRTQQVKLYGSMQHLQASIYLSYTDGLGGWNEPGESIKLLAGPRMREQHLKTLLAHEYGHVATFEMGPARMAWWILEGAAELAAEGFGDRGKSLEGTVRAWKAAGNLAPFEDMVGFDDRAKKWYGHVYGQSHHFLGYLSERFGREKRIEWLRLQAQGTPLEDATTQVYGVAFADLDAQWRESIPPPQTPTPEQDADKNSGEAKSAGDGK